MDQVYYLALLFNILATTVFASALIAAARMADKSKHSIVYTCGLLVLAAVLVRRLRKYGFFLQGHWADLFVGIPFALYVVITLALVTLITLLALRFAVQIRRSAEVSFSVLFPFYGFVCVQLAWAGLVAQPRSVETKDAPARSNHPRITIVLFDEMDRRALTVFRDQTLDVPALDRFSAESVVASAATSPTLWTETSIPSMLTGTRLEGIKRGHAGALSVQIAGDQGTRAWDQQPSLFHSLEMLGFRVGVAGWYHPYCSDMARGITECWIHAPTILPPADIGFWAMSFAIARTAPRFGLGAGGLQERVEYLQMRAQQLTTDSSLTLAYIHFSVPHAPYLRSKDGRGYLGNLELADGIFAKVRQDMESGGHWDLSTVIMTSDHGVNDFQLGINIPHQPNDVRSHEVPFMVKLPGQKAGARIDAAFSTLVLKDLVLDMAHGKVETPEQLDAWLRLHGGRYSCSNVGACPVD